MAGRRMSSKPTLVMSCVLVGAVVAFALVQTPAYLVLALVALASLVQRLPVRPTSTRFSTDLVLCCAVALLATGLAITGLMMADSLAVTLGVLATSAFICTELLSALGLRVERRD
jgi:hypothetical protein